MTPVAPDTEWRRLRTLLPNLPDPAPEAALELGPGDDCALLRLDGSRLLAVSADTCVAGQHFFADAPWEAVGYRAAATALSDLAAMGARPLWGLAAATLDPESASLEGLIAGVSACFEEYGCALIGGDTTVGPASLTLAVAGDVPAGQELRRSGAGIGDLVCVTGSLGGARLGMERWLDGDRDDGSADSCSPAGRYWRPRARIGAGIALRSLATAAIDVSDGLLLDCLRLARSSGCALHLASDAAPLHGDCPASRPRREFLAAGDDYELAFTLPPGRWEAARTALDAVGVPVARVGACRPGQGLFLDDEPQTGDLGWDALADGAPPNCPGQG